MKEDNEVRLVLQIGGRSFPVKIERSELEETKKIEEKINAKINQFMINYSKMEKIDVLIMAFLSVIFDQDKEKEGRSIKLFEKRLDDLSKLLNDSL